MYTVPHWLIIAMKNPTYTDDNNKIKCYLRTRIALDFKEFGHYFELAKVNHICVYCGETAEEEDHVIPLCATWPTYTVISCRECNSLAGTFLATSFEDKRDYVKKRLIKKYGKGALEDFSAEEQREFGPSLLTMIKTATIRNSIVRDRFYFLLEHLRD